MTAHRRTDTGQLQTQDQTETLPAHCRQPTSRPTLTPLDAPKHTAVETRHILDAAQHRVQLRSHPYLTLSWSHRRTQHWTAAGHRVRTSHRGILTLDRDSIRRAAETRTLSPWPDSLTGSAMAPPTVSRSLTRRPGSLGTSPASSRLSPASVHPRRPHWGSPAPDTSCSRALAPRRLTQACPPRSPPRPATML